MPRAKVVIPPVWTPEPGSHIRVTDAHYGEDPDARFRVDRIEEKDTRYGMKRIVHALEETQREDGSMWGFRHRAFYLEDVEDAAQPRKHAQRASRAGLGPRPTTGRCEHCGEPTRGGRFVPGHDAKLKGDLIREGSWAAAAEQIARGWPHQRDGAMATKLITAAGGADSYIKKRVAERIGEEP